MAIASCKVYLRMFVQPSPLLTINAPRLSCLATHRETCYRIRMYRIITPHRFTGMIRIPASKSHTIRRLLVAALGDGVSEIVYPLDSLDAHSCLEVCRSLGAVIEEYRSLDTPCSPREDVPGGRLVRWRVQGISAGAAGGTFKAPVQALDVGNSGTTLFLALAAGALGTEPITFTGDAQIRRRSAEPLLQALSGLGIRVASAPQGCAPITVQGPWKGGRVSLSCPTSQYLSALLLAAPLAPAGTSTEIDVPLLNEKPYITMTLSYLDAQGVSYDAAADYSWFRVRGGASYRPLNGPVPGDFSSAAFPACAGAITGGPVRLLGLDPEDTQGDKAFFSMLKDLGAEVSWEKTQDTWVVTVAREGPLQAGTFDLNATPDLFPIMAVIAAYTPGETALVHVAHARIKETDRIAVMAAELGKLGVWTEERPDGLRIRGSAETLPALRGGRVDGHGDHRVVMALAVAALGASDPVEITGAEAADVTYPGFLDLLGAAP
ncbi:MAG: 3-phosphoshikimate 1-carboxyvinyltransferase [Treponema sp.]|nr:3-phosphoshikimate 1-carboxyvinyltransferase [Treponema sp.]